jgi:hypothetical protein
MRQLKFKTEAHRHMQQVVASRQKQRKRRDDYMATVKANLEKQKTAAE